MSEQRFERIEQRLDGIDDRLGAVDRRLDGIDDRLGAVDRRLGAVDQRFDRLEAHMDSRFDELGRHMRVLHEDVIGRIGALREAPQAATKLELAELNESITRRLDPLEAAARQHSLRLDRLEQERS
jgi:archaellum component FlaC